MPDSNKKCGNPPGITVGLLAYQGGYPGHERRFREMGFEVREIRIKTDFEGISHLVVPGGESTAFLKLLHYVDLSDSIRKHHESGKPIFATCAGVILLAKEVRNPDQESLGLLDVTVERNAYGSQVDSFEADVDIPSIGEEPFHAIFIRAPKITRTGTKVEVLAKVDDSIVMVRQGTIIGTTFHPELSQDTRILEMFLGM
jgi:pyridoxal 5'-phosphate synthase pdxT subunit